MQPSVSRPDAAPLPAALIASLVPLFGAGAEGRGGVCVECYDTHSNDLAELRFADGRTLMVKRGRYPWAAERFETSRVAADLVRGKEAAIVPVPLPLREGLDDRPVEASGRTACSTGTAGSTSRRTRTRSRGCTRSCAPATRRAWPPEPAGARRDHRRPAVGPVRPLRYSTTSRISRGLSSPPIGGIPGP